MEVWFWYSGTYYERLPPLAIKIWSLKVSGLWWQVQLHWMEGRTIWQDIVPVVLQDRWSLMVVKSLKLGFTEFQDYSRPNQSTM